MPLPKVILDQLALNKTVITVKNIVLYIMDIFKHNLKYLIVNGNWVTLNNEVQINEVNKRHFIRVHPNSIICLNYTYNQ